MSDQARQRQLPLFLATTLAEIQREAIIAALDACDGDKAAAAKLLGTSRSTIYRKLKQWKREVQRPPG